MPRIFKGSESTLRLLIHTCNQEGKISDLKIALYTNDPSVAIEFTDRYTIDGNIVSLTVPNYAFGTMEDGVINYVAQGMIDDDTFLTERQSNYFLKTPANYTPTPMPEEVVLGEFTTMIVENGVFEYTPTDVDAWNKATIEVNVPSEGGTCNLGEGEIYLTPNDAGFYELYAAEDGYDGWSKFYVTLENGGAIKIHRAADLVNTFNNGEQIDFGAYYYVGGEITEVQEINVEFGNATYVLDNGLKVYRGDWIDGNPFGEGQIKVGAYIVVYGIIQDYRGELQLKAHSQVIAYKECEGDTPNPEPIPPQDGWGMVGYFNEWGGTSDIPFEENGEWEGRPYKVIRGFNAVQGEFKLRRNNTWENSYTANFYNEPQFALLQKGDWNMPIDDGVWDIYLFFGDDGEPNEMLMLYADTDLYSLQYEYTLNVSTNIQNTIIFINNSYSGMVDEYFGGSATVPMKYGNTYTIMTWMEGYENITEELTCYNNEDRSYTLTKIEGGEVSCNLEDKWMTPSMGDRDDNGYVIANPSEGFDGLSRVVIDPTTIYNEGVSAGKAEGSGLNIDAASTSLGVGDWSRWTRTAAQLGLDAMSEITIDGSQYQEWTKAHTLLEAYKNTEEAYITENGEYRANIGYDGFALKGYNVGWVIDTVPTIDTDVEMWVKPYDNAPNNWQGFIGSQMSDEDNTTFQIRKMDGNNAFSFRFGEQSFDYWFEYERWYRLRMNRNGVWVNGEQVCGWDVQAFEENLNPLMINGIYNLNFESENYRMNHASYGYVYFHNTDILYVPFKNGVFIGNNAQTIGRPATEDATLQYENNYYPKGYTKVTVDVPQSGGGSGDCNIQPQKIVELDWDRMGIYPDEGYNGISEVIVDASRKAEEWREEGRYGVRSRLQSIEITENGRYSVEDQIIVNSLRYNGGYHTDTISTYDINRIEVTFKADTSASINGQGQPFILGGSMWGLNESGEDNECARAIQYANGRIVGYWEGKWTDATSIMDGEWITITLDENGMTIKKPSYEEHCNYIYDNGNRNSGSEIFPFIIGGLGRRKSLEDGNYSASLIEDTQFRGLIKEVKINTNSMGEITYIPKNWGYGVWDRIVENTGEYLSALEPTEGEVTMNSEWERIYGEGWREINVNTPTIQDSAKDYYYCPLILGDSEFGEAAKSWDAGMVTLNNYNGDIIEDKLYVPTYSNKNEFRTKEKARFVQNLPDDVSIFGSMEFGDGVEYFVTSEGKQFTNLTDLTIGPDMNTIEFGTSTFPTLKRIWCFSETDNIDVYFSIGGSFYDTGTLYLKNHNQETEWRNSLPSGWTIVLL